jgi:hypothetical protein
MNECGACGEDFGGVSAFDAHRIGKHAYLFEEGLSMVPPSEDGRRCLSTQEMEARGFAKNARGLWSVGKDLERARKRRESERPMKQRHQH